MTSVKSFTEKGLCGKCREAYTVKCKEQTRAEGSTDCKKEGDYCMTWYIYREKELESDDSYDEYAGRESKFATETDEEGEAYCEAFHQMPWSIQQEIDYDEGKINLREV